MSSCKDLLDEDDDEEHEFSIWLDEYGYLTTGCMEDLTPNPSRRELLDWRHSFESLSEGEQLHFLSRYSPLSRAGLKGFVFGKRSIRWLGESLFSIEDARDNDYDDPNLLDANAWLDEQVSTDELTDEEICRLGPYSVGLDVFEALGPAKAEEVGLRLVGIMCTRFTGFKFKGPAEELERRLRSHGIDARVKEFL